MVEETLGTITDAVIQEAGVEDSKIETVHKAVLKRFDFLADSGVLTILPGEEVTMDFPIDEENVRDVRDLVDDVIGDMLEV